MAGENNLPVEGGQRLVLRLFRIVEQHFKGWYPSNALVTALSPGMQFSEHIAPELSSSFEQTANIDASLIEAESVCFYFLTK